MVAAAFSGSRLWPDRAFGVSDNPLLFPPADSPGADDRLVSVLDPFITIGPSVSSSSSSSSIDTRGRVSSPWSSFSIRLERAFWRVKTCSSVECDPPGVVTVISGSSIAKWPVEYDRRAAGGVRVLLLLLDGTMMEMLGRCSVVVEFEADPEE